MSIYPSKPGADLGYRGVLIKAVTYETIEDEGKDGPQITERQIVFALTQGHQPYVTWDRWVTYPLVAGKEITVTADSTVWGHYFYDLDKAYADFQERVEEKTHKKRDEAAIHQRGHDDGWNAAGWLVDGNTDDPEVVLLGYLRGIEDGDPEILDKLPTPNLSGEWADVPTWEDICQEEIERYNDDGEEELL